MPTANKEGVTAPELGAQHFPVAALYSNLPGPQPYPFFECACGLQTGVNMNWEDAGWEFDEHLKEHGQI